MDRKYSRRSKRNISIRYGTYTKEKIYIAISDKEYLKKIKQIVHTEPAKDIFSLIYNYKVELECDNKITELEEYLRNNEEGLLRYQYRLGYKEELAQRISEPKKVTKVKYKEIRYAGTAKILENITRDYTKENIKNNF